MRYSNDFGEIVKDLLEENGMSQAELARELDMPASSLSSYIRGDHKPPKSVIQDISEYFDVELPGLE